MSGPVEHLFNCLLAVLEEHRARVSGVLFIEADRVNGCAVPSHCTKDKLRVARALGLNG